VKELRQLAHYRGVPLLVLTTEASAEKKQEGKAAGATGWIVKPFNPEKAAGGSGPSCVVTIDAPDDRGRHFEEAAPTRGDQVGRRRQPPAGGHPSPEAAQALFAAIAQIGLALRESQEPVAELGTVLARLTEALSAASPGPSYGNNCTPTSSRNSAAAISTTGWCSICRTSRTNLICVGNELDSPTPPPAVGDVVGCVAREVTPAFDLG